MKTFLAIYHTEKQTISSYVNTLKSLLNNNGYNLECFLLNNNDELLNKAPEWYAQYDGIISVGGDGLLHYIINAMLTNKIYSCPISSIPSGTSNSFCFSTGIFSPEDLVQAIQSNSTIQIDVGKLTLNGSIKYVISMVHYGITADVAELAEKIRFLGLIRNKISAFIACFLFKGFKIKGKIDNTPIAPYSIMAQFTYGPALSKDSRFLLAPKLDLSDGKLDIITIAQTSIAQKIKIFTSIKDGSYTKLPYVKYQKAELVSFKANKGDVINVDGELHKIHSSEISLAVLPQKITAFVNTQKYMGSS